MAMIRTTGPPRPPRPANEAVYCRQRRELLVEPGRNAKNTWSEELLWGVACKDWVSLSVILVRVGMVKKSVDGNGLVMLE